MVPITTPVRSPAMRSAPMPESSTAMRAAATAKAEQRPTRRASAAVRKSRARKPFTSPAMFRPICAVSKSVTGEIPERPASKASQ